MPSAAFTTRREDERKPACLRRLLRPSQTDRYLSSVSTKSDADQRKSFGFISGAFADPVNAPTDSRPRNVYPSSSPRGGGPSKISRKAAGLCRDGIEGEWRQTRPYRVWEAAQNRAPDGYTGAT